MKNVRPNVYGLVLLTVMSAFAPRLAGAEVAAACRDWAQLLEPLAVGAGRVLPSDSFPYSPTFALKTAAGLLERTQGAVRFDVEKTIETVSGQDATAVSVSFTAAYERFVRPVVALPYAEYLSFVDPVFVLELSYQLDLSTALCFEFTGMREYQAGMGDDNFLVPRSGNPIALENNSVSQGYLYVSRGPAELTFGRQKISIGPSRRASLLVSPTLPFLDALDLKLHLGRLGMTMLVSTLENSEADGDVTIPPGSQYAFDETVILFNTHYFECDFGFLRAGIGANVIITRPQNGFQISDFFAVFSWHNANIKPNNLSLVFDLSAVPFRGLELYGQLGFDDINTDFFGVSDSGTPTIPAGLCGLSWHGGWQRFPVRVDAETGFTHHLWGSFLDSAPMARAIYRMDLDGEDRWIPLTSPFGPGTFWALAEATLGTPWKLSASTSLRFLSRNTAASLVGPYEGDPAVANAPRDVSLVLDTAIRYDPFPWLRVSLESAVHFEEEGAWAELTIRARSCLTATGR